jgi:hypothetical protein
VNGLTKAVLVTLQFALSCLVIQLMLGLGLALAISRIVLGGGALRTLVLIPTMITPAVAAINFRTQSGRPGAVRQMVRHRGQDRRRGPFDRSFVRPSERPSSSERFNQLRTPERTLGLEVRLIPPAHVKPMSGATRTTRSMRDARSSVSPLA